MAALALDLPRTPCPADVPRRATLVLLEPTPPDAALVDLRRSANDAQYPARPSYHYDLKLVARHLCDGAVVNVWWAGSDDGAGWVDVSFIDPYQCRAIWGAVEWGEDARTHANGFRFDRDGRGEEMLIWFMEGYCTVRPSQFRDGHIHLVVENDEYLSSATLEGFSVGQKARIARYLRHREANARRCRLRTGVD